MTTNTPIFVDALPYIDTAIDDDDDQRALAMKEVDDELELFPPDKDYLADMPDISIRPFKTELLDKELSRLETDERSDHVGLPIEQINVEVPPPTSSKMTEEQLELWEKCLTQVRIKIEYRQRQLMNLELLNNYGQPAWEQYIAQHEKLEKELKMELEDLNKRTQEVNWSRKTEQEKILKQLQVLQNEWNNLATKNHRIKSEIQQLSK